MAYGEDIVMIMMTQTLFLMMIMMNQPEQCYCDACIHKAGDFVLDNGDLFNWRTSPFIVSIK